MRAKIMDATTKPPDEEQYSTIICDIFEKSSELSSIVGGSSPQKMRALSNKRCAE
jgi:hypothetical protein